MKCEFEIVESQCLETDLQIVADLASGRRIRKSVNAESGRSPIVVELSELDEHGGEIPAAGLTTGGELLDLNGELTSVCSAGEFCCESFNETLAPISTDSVISEPPFFFFFFEEKRLQALSI